MAAWHLYDNFTERLCISLQETRYHVLLCALLRCHSQFFFLLPGCIIFKRTVHRRYSNSRGTLYSIWVIKLNPFFGDDGGMYLTIAPTV